MNHPTLHLSHSTKSTHHAQSFNQSSSLYSLTRNSLDSSIARCSSKVSMTRKTHTKAGDVTMFGLLKGYIQASTLAHVNVCIDYSHANNEIVVAGRIGDSRIYRRFGLKEITKARKYLRSLK